MADKQPIINHLCSGVVAVQFQYDAKPVKIIPKRKQHQIEEKEEELCPEPGHNYIFGQPWKGKE